MTYTIKPSDIYPSREHVQKALGTGWRIVDFRPRKDGDYVLWQDGVIGPAFTSSVDQPRFIVERITRPEQTDWWE